MIAELRHELHKYPELSGREKETAQRIIGFFNKYSPDKIESNIGGYGLISSYEFSADGPTIVIRCDLDALPIQEYTALKYRSLNKGVSHKCGHDGHMAIVAGLAPWLSERHFKKGKVHLLFQPAEETGSGALAMLENNVLKKLNPDYVIALHNLPSFPLHSVIIGEGKMTPTVMSITISLHGQVAHAAEPQKGINPTMAISTLNMAITNLANNDSEDPSYSMITPVHTRIGNKDFGISPGEGELSFTLRTWNKEAMLQLKKEIKRIIEDTCILYKLKHSIKESDYFPSVENSDKCNKIIAFAAKELGLEIISLERAINFGEDFGFFTQKYNAALFGLGAGKNALPLHHPDYDFEDELIDTGMDMFKKIIENLLK